MRTAATVLLFSFCSMLPAQSFQSFADHVNSLSDTTAKLAAVDSFMMANPELPHLYSDTATFVFQGTANSVTVPGVFNEWDLETPIDKMTILPGTDLWYLSKSFELNARLDYRFVLNGTDVILDPNNSNTQPINSTEFWSVLAMPDYVWPWEVNAYPSVPKGVIEQISVSSTYTNKTYDVYVYLPPDYHATGDNGYPTAYFNDALAYIWLVQAGNIFDNLIDSGLICQTIGIFVEPTDRDFEYYAADRNNFRMFFVNELVPYIDSAYHTLAVPESRAVIGLSASANIAALIGYNHPAVFGNVGLHSAAFIYNGWETYNLIVDGIKKEIRWASVWGTYDISWLIPNMKLFRDNLLTKGYAFEWRELPEGHSFGLFKSTLDIMLEFFSDSCFTTSIQEPIVGDMSFSIFPNPSYGNTSASFELIKPGSVALTLIDVNGRNLAEINTDVLHPGSHELSLSTEVLAPGMYFMILKAGSRVSIRKLAVQ